MAAVLAAGTLAACGNTESESTQTTLAASGETEGGNTDTASEVSEENGADSVNTSGTGTYNVTWDDMEDIIVVYPSMGPIPSGLQAVEDEINKITEEEINTHVTLNMIEVGNYDQQMNLMISSGETVDLMITMPGGTTAFSAMASQKPYL